MKTSNLYVGNSAIQYRSDIDGLRAIAVLAVLFYHLEWKMFGGGYIGVDIFFVISGFLITTMILRELNGGHFSLMEFYRRRIQRIFPALFIMIFFTLLGGAWLYNDQNYLDLGKSTLAAALSTANLYFWSTVGYFDASPLLKPLLHTWSLSVEEQFYLVLPLLLMLVHLLVRERSLILIVFLLMLSFALSASVARTSPPASFYFPHLRAWELLAGSVIAYKPVKFPGAARGLLDTLGLILIMAPVTYYSATQATPWWTALPVLGTALIINNGVFGSSWVTRVLSLPAMRSVGQISYSLYLWHWPMLVFAKSLAIVPLDAAQSGLLIGLILGVSVVSWKFIEVPLRKPGLASTRHIFLTALGGVACLALFSSLVIFGHGLPMRYDARQDMGGEAVQIFDTQRELCGNEEWKKGTPKFCELGKQDVPPSFLVWGDSYAMVLNPGISKAAERVGVAGWLASKSQCPPFDQVGSRTACINFSDAVLTEILKNPNISTIILAGHWNYDREETLQGLQNTVKALDAMQRRVVIVAATPRLKLDVLPAYFVASRTKRDLNALAGIPLAEYQAQNKWIEPLFHELKVRHPAVTLLSLEAVLCPDHNCPVVMNGKPIYLDYHHLSVFGSDLVSQLFDVVISPSLP